MKLQTDLKFQQIQINRLNEKYNFDMFSTKVRGRKAFAAEQKITEFKKLIFRSKKLHKATKTGRVNPQKLIRNAVQNMNKTNSQKHGMLPEEVEEKSLADEQFREIYDFHRMVRVSKDADRYEHSDICFDKKSCRKLRSPLAVGQKVLALAERLRKKDAPGNLYKSSTENMSFFNCEQVLIVMKVFPQEDSHNYWISKMEDGEIIDKRFLRFYYKSYLHLKINLIKKKTMEPIFIYYSNLKFKENKIFTIEFSNEDQLQSIMFRKAKDYYLTNTSCFIQLTSALTKLENFSDIKKISDLSKSILKNGIDHEYVEKYLEAFSGGGKTELEPDKSNHVLSVEVV